MPKFYLTTAIDYSNAEPHLGQALEKIGADCIARYRRLRGDDVHFVMGMDEHSQSVIQAAARAGVAPQAWVERMAATFAGYWRRLHCSHDDWIRTTEPRHARTVTTLLERIRQRRPDDLFEGDYEGLYCTGCEEFKTEAQIVDGRCIEHPTLELVPTKERNHFFRLSAYRDAVLERIRSGALAVEPEIRRNEVVRLLEAGLQDISISRQRQPWGIPFPGDSQQTVYVWFDALINYLSATGFPDDGYERLWPADLHVIGKNITRFHCITWPAMLLAAGVAVPRAVWAHGFVLWGGAKMSKTAGTAVTLDEAIARHGVDALRYFLLREVGFASDGEFTWERFDARYVSDLADTFGNLVKRSLDMIHRYRGGTVPRDPSGSREAPSAAPRRTPSRGPAPRQKRTVAPRDPSTGAAPLDGPLDDAARDCVAAYQRAMDAYRLEDGAARWLDLAARANRYIQETVPWELAKAGKDAELDAVLAGLARTVARLAVLAQPFLPATAEMVWGLFGPATPLGQVRLAEVTSLDVAGRQVAKAPILFPKPATAGAGSGKRR